MNININDYIKLKNDDSYNLYYNWFFNYEELEKYARLFEIGAFPSTDKIYKVVALGYHGDVEDRILAVLYDEEYNRVYLVDADNCIVFKNEFSFRFNEERKSVTLYRYGEKVQFVKCHEDDKFSWKIGLGVALYKYLFDNGKNVPKDVLYVKDIVNWKVFYCYIVAYVFKFDKQKIEKFENRVKNAKQYKEIKLWN